MRILHISCSYLPDNIGGTEVYVHNLSKELILRGYEIFVSFVTEFSEAGAPIILTREYIFEDVPVFVIEKNIFNQKTKDLYMNENLELHRIFQAYLKKIQPDIIHFHHFSSTDVLSQMKAAKEMRIPIILTYHTPMMTCSHSDMLYLGEKPCDGKIEYKRCLICVQTKYGIPFFLASIWTRLPEGIAESLGKFISNAELKFPFATWLQLPWLTKERIKRWRVEFKMVDHFVAVCQWVFNLLLKNNIPPEHITLCRQGIASILSDIKKQHSNTLRLGYIGRIHPVKGIDIILRAFKFLPSHYQIELYVYGSFQNRYDKKYYNRLRRQSYKDKRIKWLGILKGADNFQALSQIDVVVIPSRWLETGPLVLLESWAVGTPVIGADLGGISELVNEGIGGLLFKPEDVQDLVRVITRIYREPDLLQRLKEKIPKVRTIEEVSSEMGNLYHRLKKDNLYE